MAHPTVDKITGYYSSLAELWLDRWGRIVNHGRAGTYTPAAWAADAASTVSEITGSIRFAVDLIDPPVSIAEVSMSIVPNAAQVVEAVWIPTSTQALQATDLAAVDDPSKRISASNVGLALVSGGRLLVVTLEKMDQNPTRPLLTTGRQFKGDIHVQGNAGDVKARILLNVV
jgi:hypothetical protein